MPAGASTKREQEYKSLQRKFKQEGRYKGREEEVASRIVNKQRAALGETRQEKQARKAGKAPDRHLPLENFETMTIAQARGRLGSLNTTELKKLQAYEMRHKNRKGMLAELQRHMKYS